MDRGMYSTPDLRSLLAATRDQNPRAKFWSQVCKVYPLSELPSSERQALVRLSEGHEWMSNINEELREEYTRLYEEAVDLPSSFELAVRKDISRTFGLFAAEMRAMGSRRPAPGVYETALGQLLLATSQQCEYCQGMNFVGATLILEQYEVKDAFALFMFAMKERHLNVLYSSHSSSLPDYISVYDKLLQRYNPRVYQHFHSIGFLPIMYAIEWFTTLFSVSTSKRLTMYLFDLFLAGFEDIMIRVGLAVVQVLEHEILKRTAEELQMEFKLLVRKLRPAQVFPLALAYKIHPTLDVLATIYNRMSCPLGASQHGELPIEFEVEEAITVDDQNNKLIQEIASPTLLDMLAKVEYCVFNCSTHEHTPSCAFSAIGMVETARSQSVPATGRLEHGHQRKATMKNFFKNLFEDVPTTDRAKKDMTRVQSEPVISLIDSVRVLDPVTKQFCPKRDGWLPPVITDWFTTDQLQEKHSLTPTADTDAGSTGSDAGNRDREVEVWTSDEEFVNEIPHAPPQDLQQQMNEPENSQEPQSQEPKVEEELQPLSEGKGATGPVIDATGVGCE